jgi:hypothetical protein
MKVYFNRIPRHSPYGGGTSFVTNMIKYLEDRGVGIAKSLNEGDITHIFMIDPRPEFGNDSINEIARYKHFSPGTKVLHRVNECDKRKNTQGMDDLLLKSNQVADETVFISEWLKGYFVEIGFSKSCHVINNGCDTTVFYPPATKRPLIGPYKLVTHHWADNWYKGFDAYIMIDELLDTKLKGVIEFTYVGRYWQGYTPKNTKIVQPLYGKELADELRKHDVYVTASRWEPHGMHHRESKAVGLPILFHKEGGAIPDMCKNYGIQFEDENTFISALHNLIGDYFSYRSKIDYKELSSDRCCAEYYEILKNM